MFLTDLADAARKSGLPVVEIAGWKSRGALHPTTRVPRGLNGPPQTIVCHHTGTTARASGDYPTLTLIQRGRSDLPGPLAQIGLGRDGTVYVIAAGRANHAGETWLPRQGNGWSIGIEAEHPGGTAPWTPTQRRAYVRLVRALCDHYEIPLAHVQSHAEVASPVGRKVDPNFPMPAFRDEVAAATPEDDLTPEQDNRLKNVEKALDRLLGGAEPGFSVGSLVWNHRLTDKADADPTKWTPSPAGALLEQARRHAARNLVEGAARDVLLTEVREAAKAAGVSNPDALAADVAERLTVSVRASE